MVFLRITKVAMGGRGGEEVIDAVSETVSVAAVVQADVLAASINAAAVVTTTAPAKVAVPSTRQRRGVVIRDPEKESSAKTLNKTKSKDKKKGVSLSKESSIDDRNGEKAGSCGI
nr:hypothetical protein [Tanacetum cinerariifolium]